MIGPSDAWAVGYGVSSNVPYETITEHWNGSSWQIVPSPNNATPGFYNALNDVSAISSNDVWAVGGVPTGFGAIAGRSLLMHWDGASWQLLPEPPETLSWSTDHALRRHCPRLKRRLGRRQVRCLALGWLRLARRAGSGQNLADIDTNGTALWSVGTVPGGYVEGYYSPPVPIAEYLNGTTWSSTSPVVNDHTNGAGFNAVKVIASNNVWAVGRTGAFALTEQWNGTAWTSRPGGPG